jgi:hypothetical protein
MCLPVIRFLILCRIITALVYKIITITDISSCSFLIQHVYNFDDSDWFLNRNMRAKGCMTIQRQFVYWSL